MITDMALTILGGSCVSGVSFGSDQEQGVSLLAPDLIQGHGLNMKWQGKR